MVPYDTLQNTSEAGGQQPPNLEVISRAILLERLAKLSRSNTPWRGQLIYRLGFTLRDLWLEFTSPPFAHTFRQTTVSATIAESYRAINGQVTDWASENFQSLKQKLHVNRPYKKRTARNYDDTWVHVLQETYRTEL